MSKGDINRTQARLVMAALLDYTKEHGYPPSIADLVQLTGKGRSTVAYHLACLERWGWVRHEAGKNRTWRIIHQVLQEDDSEIEGPTLT